MSIVTDSRGCLSVPATTCTFFPSHPADATNSLEKLETVFILPSCRGGCPNGTTRYCIPETNRLSLSNYRTRLRGSIHLTKGRGVYVVGVTSKAVYGCNSNNELFDLTSRRKVCCYRVTRPSLCDPPTKHRPVCRSRRR